jgi:formamidopyrimidine-DNA glycosylase
MTKIRFTYTRLGRFLYKRTTGNGVSGQSPAKLEFWKAKLTPAHLIESVQEARIYENILKYVIQTLTRIIPAQSQSLSDFCCFTGSLRVSQKNTLSLKRLDVSHIFCGTRRESKIYEIPLPYCF